MSCSVRGSDRALPALRTREAAIRRQAADDRLDQLDQRPDRGDANRAGADETHLRDSTWPARGRRPRPWTAGQRGEMRHAPAPADHRAEQHRDADPQADEMADREQRHRQREIETGHRRRAAADAKSLRDVAGEHARGDDHRERRRDDRAPDHRAQTRAAFFHSAAVRCRRRCRP